MSDQISITRDVSNAHEKSNKSTYPTEVVDLPSRGYFYSAEDPLSNGQVELKMMTAKEEDILTNENFIKKGTVLDKLLESLIVGPTGVNYKHLLVTDKNALYIAARRLAYGDTYGPLDIICPNCETKNSVTIDLSDLKEKEYDFSNLKKGVSTFKFTLPYSKRVVEYRILSSSEEEQIEDELKALSKKLHISGGQITTRLKKLIVSLDSVPDAMAISKFVDNELLSRDSIALRNDVKKNTPEIDLKYDFECSSCSHEERMDVPMTVRFFWPES